MSTLKPYQNDLIGHSMAVGALKFGSFTLKSGRYVGSIPKVSQTIHTNLGNAGSRHTFSTPGY
jgi:hypothetical protein